MRVPSALAIPLLCLAAGLQAQEPNATQPAAPRPAEAGPDERAQEPEAKARTVAPPIVVVARKWEEDAADVPQSLTVVGEQTLQETGIRSIRDAGFRVPNLFVNEFSSRRLSFPTMRGIGSGQGDPAVVTYIGGVPQLTTNTTNLPLIDVERIEFLRGPQGTLFGRNALGGVIQIIEKRPASELEADASAAFGNFGMQEYRLSSSGPVVEDRLAFRLSLLQAQRDGFTVNDFSGRDVDDKEQLFGRAELQWTPDRRWELALKVYGERARDGGFVLSELTALRARPRHIDQDFEGLAHRDVAGLTLVATRLGDGVEFTSISSLQDWGILETADFDFSRIDGVRRRTEESQTAFEQELRWSSSPDEDVRLGEDATLKWLFGLHGFLADSSRSAANDYRPGGAGILFPPAQVGVDTSSGEFDDWSLAAFGQSTATLWQDWDFTVGLRYDHEHKRAALHRTFAVGGTVVAESRQRLDADYDQLVPQASIGWHTSGDVLVYGRVAEGFKAGGFNLAAPAGGFAYRPETSRTWEVGIKSAWLEQRLHLDIAAFYTDWEDMQLSLFDAATGGYVANAGAATSRGFELETRADVGGGLELSGSFGYTDATFDRFTDAYGVDVSGRALAFVPETTWNLAATYGGDLGEKGRWFVSCDWAGVGTYFYDAGNRASESFDLLGLHAGVDQGRVRFSAFVRNLLDQDYVQVAFQPSPADPSVFVGESGAPRTFGFDLTVRF